MLLLPLGLDPVWVDAQTVQRGDLYYGLRDSEPRECVIALPYSRQAARYFATPAPYPAQQACVRQWDGESWPVLFNGRAPEADDLVASAFFWLSGWQEHVTMQRDEHARFAFRDSLQAALGVATRPVVDAYRQRLAFALEQQGAPIRPRTWGTARWALCPTIDVDYIVKWRKGMVYRELVEYFLCNRRCEKLKARLGRLRRFLLDALRPGDVYQQALTRMHHTVRKHGTGTVFLKAAAHGPQDVRYRLHHPFLQGILPSLMEDGFELGVHPSYHAHTHLEYMTVERQAIAALAGRAPRSVRQHFLRYEAPATQRIQELAGFRIDSTLGFAEHEGFRNGTCLPFLRFDNAANRAGSLWEMPLAVMDSALFNRRKLDLAAATEATRNVLRQCRRFGGAAVMLWHNLLWDELDHPDWGAHFLESVAWATRRGARVVALRQGLEDWLNGTDIDA